MLSWFERLLGRTEKRALTFEDLASVFGIIPTASGISVTADSALSSPTFLAATRALSETIGMLPLAVRRREGESWKRIGDHPAARLLHGFSNPWTGATDLRTQLQIDALLHKVGGVAQIIRAQGKPKELHRLPPRSVTIKIDETSGEPKYEIAKKGGGTTTLPWRDVLHIQAPGSAPDRPMAPLELCRNAVALDIAMASHQASIFANGGLPRIVLSPEGQVSPDAIANAIKFFTQQATGESTGKPIVLPAAFKEAFKSFGLSEMQFLELRRLVIEEIARAMRVPAQLIGDLSKATYNNVETAGRHFLIFSLLPWLETWEAALTRALIPEGERDTTELEFITEDLLRGDTPTRFRAYREAAGGAWLLRDEVRELEGLPPVPGGDVLLNQAGQTGADSSPDENEDADDA